MEENKWIKTIWILMKDNWFLLNSKSIKKKYMYIISHTLLSQETTTKFWLDCLVCLLDWGLAEPLAVL